MYAKQLRRASKLMDLPQEKLEAMAAKNKRANKEVVTDTEDEGVSSVSEEDEEEEEDASPTGKHTHLVSFTLISQFYYYSNSKTRI